jgi:HEAT repeat protein
VAAIQALGDLRSSQAVRPLAQLLDLPGFGGLVAEALARIGGAAVFRALAACWLARGDALDPEATLGLLAHVAEGLTRHPRAPVRLRERLAENLDAPSAEVRRDAARCLLALGPGPLDDAAIDILAAGEPGHQPPPPAVLRRPDLTSRLLARRDAAQGWGFFLAARTPHAVPAGELFAALDRLEAPGELAAPIARTLSRLRDPRIGPVLLRFFRRLPSDARRSSAFLLKKHAGFVRSALAAAPGLDDATRLVVSAFLGEPADGALQRLLALPRAKRLAVLEQLADVRPLMRLLPWEAWLDEAPRELGPLAAEVACRTGLRELLPALRRAASEHPAPALLRALGELRDRDSTELLLHLLATRPDLRPVVSDSLGRIGGPEVRTVLRQAASGCAGGEARLLYRALALCATVDDAPLFRAVVAHPDWYVRLAAAEVLGRFPAAENQPALSILAADPVPAVAHRALSSLDG